MKVLITGHSGMLGKDLSNVFKEKGAKVFGYDKTSNPEFEIEYQFVDDLNNEHALLNALNEIDPDLIIYTAAIVNLDLCETDREMAKSVHIDAAEFLAKNKNANTKFYYISTDSVFDGTKGNYTEEDQTCPLNYYSQSKNEGENRVLKFLNTLVIRTNIYGFNIPLKNSFAEWAIKCFSENKTITGFVDVIFNAIYTKDLAKIIAQLTHYEMQGIINIACAGKWSKYDFLQSLAENLKFDNTLIKKGISTSINYEIKRPQNTYLNISKLNEKIKMPSLTESLNNFCTDFKNSQR